MERNVYLCFQSLNLISLPCDYIELEKEKEMQLFMILEKKRPVCKIVSIIMTLSMICTLFCGLTIPTSAANYDLLNPISGTVQGTGYDERAGHYGIDLYPYNYGDPVYAVSSGTLMYSCERNHTREYQSGDDCCTVKIILDEPLTYNGVTYVCAFYTHMSSLVYDVYCGYKDACVAEYNAGMRTNALPTESVHVNAGDLIGYVGKGNGATHLHFSFEASEADGYAMMPNSEYYDVFGWSYNGSISAGGTTSITKNIAATYSTGLTLDQLKAKFPEGKYWNGGDINSYTSSPCTCKHNTSHTSGSSSVSCKCNSFWGSIQCAGFALKVLYDAYGQDCTEWPKKTNASYIDQVKPGDYIRYRNDGHSVVVIAVNGDNITVGECNWGSPCRINWTRTESKSHFKSTFTHVYVAPYALTGGSTVHSHSYSITEYEALHPHKAYVKCSCGEFGGYTGATTYVGNCSLCNDSCSCSTNYAGTYKCVTSNYPLTIRSGHGTNYDAVGSIPAGATVTVTKGNGSWAHVTYGGVSGYASMEYLTLPLQQTSAYPVPFKCFPLSDAQHAANAYDSVNGNEIGYIYGDDYCTVKAVYDNGWCLVNCPWNGGTKDVYTWTAFFLNMTCSPYTEVVQGKADTYTRLGSSSVLGWVDKGDRVTIVDNTSTRAQIIYPHSDGTYRCAWVNYDPVFTHVHTPGPAATCIAPQVCTSCDAIITGIQSHTPGPAATCTSNQICTVCRAVLKEKIAHTPGSAATCTSPQTCTVCGIAINNAKGHSYTAGDYTEPTHPHVIYNTCACGARWDSGQTATISSCEICNPPVTYEITFVTNGGSPTILPHYKKQGETITLSSLTKNGYSFLGWDTDSSADTAVYKAGAVYTVTGNATLYAVWKQDAVNVTGISLNKTSLTVDVGDTVTLTATVTPSNATNKAVSWSSTNTSVATVTNGTVNTLKAGTATITATTSDGNFSSSCVIKVEDTQIDKPTITISDTKGYVGNQVKVPISITNNPGIVSMTLEVTYDTTVFKLVGVNDTGLLVGAMHSDVYSSPYTLTWENDTSRVNFDVTGTLVELVFEISDNAATGTYEFSVRYPKDGIYDLDGTNIEFAMDNGSCQITDYLLGDVNGDGEVTNKDRLMLSRYLAKWDGYEIDKLVFDAADINGDGDITNRDRLLLSRHLAKWDGYENLYDI